MAAKKVHGKTMKSNLLTVAVIAVISLTVLAVCFIGNRYAMRNTYQSSDGVFDLTGCDFDSGKAVNLNGNWRYYNDTLITEDANADGKKAGTVTVPQAQSGVLEGDIIADLSGCASYACTLRNVTANDYLTVYIPSFSSAYRIFINNVLVTVSGNVSRNVDEIWTTSTYEGIPFLLEAGSSYEIVIEVASGNNASLYMPVRLANYSYDGLVSGRNSAFRFVMCGLLLSSIFIFIILKRFVNRELYSLWLPALSFVLLVRTLMTGDSFSVVQSFLRNTSFESVEIFTFVATFIIKLVSLIYITKCLKIKTSDNVFVGFSALFLVLAVLIGYLPDSIFDVYYYTILQLLSSIIDIYIINKLCVEIAKKTEYSLLYLLSYIFVIVGILIDVLYSNGVVHIDCSFVMPLCFLLFVVFTAGIHTRRIRKVFDYAVESQRLQTELERANNAIMLSQIQPHFMYNALNTIKSLIKRDPDKAEQAVIDFSMYLRGNMDSLSKVDPIPFSEELGHIKHYCNIEQLRFRDKLDIFYEIGPDSFFVPTLSVQPIVENAIKHGVTKRPEGGSVTISTDEDEDNYYITVEDDGIGFDVNAPVKQDDTKRSHVGLKNIKERFEVMMGAEVRIESKYGEGTTVTVKLPKQTNFQTLQESLEYNESRNTFKELEI